MRKLLATPQNIVLQILRVWKCVWNLREKITKSTIIKSCGHPGDKIDFDRTKRNQNFMPPSGFCKTLPNRRGFGVCTWWNKVCSWQFWFTLDNIWFPHRLLIMPFSAQKAVILSVNELKVFYASDALKYELYDLPQNFRSWITKFILSLYEVWVGYCLTKVYNHARY